MKKFLSLIFLLASVFAAESGPTNVTVRPSGISAGNTGELRFLELLANGNNYIGFKAPDTITANKIWVLPSADGTVGQVIQTNGAGVLSFADSALAANVALRDATNTFTSTQTFQSYIANQTYSPTQITGNQNNYDFGTTTFIRLDSDAARTVTGLANGVNGRTLIIANIGAFDITLSHQSASSTATNRIISPSGADAVLSADYCAFLIYDSVTSGGRWRIISFYQIGGGGGGTITGSGTSGKVARFTGAANIADSLIRDNGSNVAVNQAVDASYMFAVSGKIKTDNQLVSTIVTGTAPLAISSTTLVSNLNVEKLNSQVGTYYTNMDNAASGTLAVNRGGTGLVGYAVGDIIYANGATSLTKLSDIATGNALISGGVTTAPSWGKIGLTTHVSGILPVANGGLGNFSLPASGNILVCNNIGTYSPVAMSNDATISSAGVLTVANNVISIAKQASSARPTYNYLVNGGFDFCQRQTPGDQATGPSDGFSLPYNADHWYVLAEGNLCSGVDTGTVSTISANATVTLSGGNQFSTTCVGGLCKLSAGITSFSTITSWTNGTNIVVGVGSGPGVASGLSYSVSCIDHTRTTGDTRAASYSAYSGQYRNNGQAQRYGIAQILESKNAIALRGRPVTFQISGLSNVTPGLRVAILTWNNAAAVDNLGASRNFINSWANAADANPATTFFRSSNISVVGYSAATTLSSTFQDLSCTGTIGNTACNVMVFVWTSSTVAQTKSINITKAGLYDGSSTRDWIPRLEGEELALCQRYYSKTASIEQGPYVTGDANGSISTLPASGAVGAASMVWSFPVRMRTYPTVIVYNYFNGTKGQMADSVHVGITVATPSISETAISITNSGTISAGNYVYARITADADF